MKKIMGDVLKSVTKMERKQPALVMKDLNKEGHRVTLRDVAARS